MTEAMTNARDFDEGRPYRIVRIEGGEGVRRRLFALGFHPGDLVAVTASGILRGPVVLRNVDTGVSVAIGRGIAQKIIAEPADERA
jgi:Fe2+ transport system protein FeoA